MQGYTRVTKLHNIGGRANYISNPARQEEIVVKSAPIDWKPYVQYELEHQKSKEKNNQGREIVFSIPNEWAELQKSELRERVQHLCETAVGKSTDLQWAVHWNHDRTNLHVHVIFSERTRIPEAECKVYDRDVYLTADGKVARKKADRARDENSNIKPPVHRKGEQQGEFTAKDTAYLKRTFNKSVRIKLEKEMTDRYGVVFEEKNPLKQFHHGKGSDSETIKKKNEIINEANYLLSVFDEIGHDNLYKGLIRDFKETVKEKRTPVIYYNSEANKIGLRKFYDPIKAYEFFQETKDLTRNKVNDTKVYVVSQKTVDVWNEFKAADEALTGVKIQKENTSRFHLTKRKELSEQEREFTVKRTTALDKLKEMGVKPVSDSLNDVTAATNAALIAMSRTLSKSNSKEDEEKKKREQEQQKQSLDEKIKAAEKRSSDTGFTMSQVKEEISTQRNQPKYKSGDEWDKVIADRKAKKQAEQSHNQPVKHKSVGRDRD